MVDQNDYPASTKNDRKEAIGADADKLLTMLNQCQKYATMHLASTPEQLPKSYYDRAVAKEKFTVPEEPQEMAICLV